MEAALNEPRLLDGVAGGVRGDVCTRDYSPLFEKVALIDGDIVCHRAAAVAEKKHYLVLIDNTHSFLFDSAKEASVVAVAEGAGAVWSRTEDKGADFAVEALRTSMNSILARSRPSSYEVWLSGRKNFRYDVAKTTPYKGSREGVPKPKHYKTCKEILINEYGAQITEGHEADDELSIRMREIGGEGFICSIDKDLDQTPGWKFNWVKDTCYRVSRREADFQLYSQSIAGDSTDDVPGIVGFGDTKARRILEGARTSSELFERSSSAYRDLSGKGSSADCWRYFLEQINLVYILRERGRFYRPPYVPEWALNAEV